MNSGDLIIGEFVEKVFHFDCLESTNSFAKNLRELPQCGLFVVIADEQSAGRGQRENSFWSPVGGLYVSIICPLADIGKHFHLNRAVSLAISDSIKVRRPDADVSIKWPNDIYMFDKKVCGILLESTLHSTRHVVVGFGLNVNTDIGLVSSDLRHRIAVMKAPSGSNIDIKDLLGDICGRFQAYRVGDPEAQHALYLRRFDWPTARTAW